jgi:hypothetical protein
METIFLQIASYRDPQLIPTINSCIEAADFPERLVFGICRQFNPDEDFDVIPKKLLKDYQFRIKDVLYTDAEGVCWARNQIQQLYGGEDYTLQLDSHHRFEKGWDTTLIDMVKQLQEQGYKKPLLTTYAPSFDPDNDPASRNMNAWEMKFDRFIPEGAIFFLPQTMQGWQSRTEPKKGRFYSAHFAFTIGKFAEEVQHDPNYYFHGEEISIAVRAFTHGYDLFHPHKPVIWHEYTRKGRVKHWDDDKAWHKRNKSSHARNRELFEMDGATAETDFGKYGFGTERTVRDYERYAGICFSKRAITNDALQDKEPSHECDLTEDEWAESFVFRFKHCIDVNFNQVPLDDYDFWCVAYKDKDGKEIFRKDAPSSEIQRMKKDPDGYCKLWREFDTKEQPGSWLVWPHSKSKDWCDMITGTLG